MCCGQKRAALRSSSAATTRGPSPGVPRSMPPQGFRPQSYQPPQVQTVSRPTSNLVARLSPPPARVASPSSPNGSVIVRYVEHSPIRVQGSQTGRMYEFSGQQPIQAVDMRDAASLLATRFFRRAQ